MTGQIISHYKILEKLGEGGMGIVYKAHDIQLKRIVALKFLPRGLEAHQAERARFLQEAQAAAALNHPNICTIYGIEEADGKTFIAMEFVDGKTLREKIGDSSLQISDCIKYAIQIGDALQEAHSKGIVHRDVKADNIMVNSKNQIKVMDFGLAKLKGSLKLTKTSSTVGTLAYMAPEQIQGGEVDARSDIFSFGVVLFEMLTGHLPFRGEHEAAMMYSIVNEEAMPLQQFVPEASSELMHIVTTALEKNAEERYQSASEMVRDLRRAQKQTSRVSRTLMTAGQVPTSFPASQSTQTGLRSRKMLWLGIGAVSLTIIVTVILLFFRGPSIQLNPNATFHTLPVPYTQIFYHGLSSDGNTVAFPATDANGKTDIYVMHASGNEIRRVTFDSTSESAAASADVSPDGSQISFSRVNARTHKTEICIVSTYGGLSKKITEPGAYPKWRPDGQRIGYIIGSLESKSKKLEFWSFATNGSDNRIEFVDSVSIETRSGFSWAPDGRSVAWVRTFSDQTQEILIRELESGRERQITFDKKNIDDICWTSQNQIIFSSNKSGNTNLWMVPMNGGDAVQLTKGSGPDLGLRISADGKRLIYLQQQTIGHIWIANIDGSNLHQVTFDDVNIGRMSLSPDGNQIAFVMWDPDPFKETRSIFLMDRNGTNRHEIARGKGIARFPQFSPDGKWISFLSYAPSEPWDSQHVLFIEAANPGTPPRSIRTGEYFRWIDAQNYVVYHGDKSFMISLDGGEEKQVYEDSTFAFPILNRTYLLYFDFRKGREGVWIIASSSEGLPIGKPRRVYESTSVPHISPDGTCILVVNNVGELSKISLPDGVQKRIQASFPGLHSSPFPPCLSFDGREVVFVDSRTSAKLGIIENLFK